LIMRSFEDFKFKMANQEKELKQIILNTTNVLDEFTDIKDTMRNQNKSFAENLSRINSYLITYQADLRKQISELWNFTGKLNLNEQDHQGHISEMFERVKESEKEIQNLDKARIKLEMVKCDNTVFDENRKRTDTEINELNAFVSATKDHCKALDHYLYKFQPVKMQNMISDTMRSILTGNERRSHELYEAEKNSLLYKLVLSDNDGDDGMIRKLMAELTHRATEVIEEEEKAKRRQMQLAAATEQIDEDEDENTGGDGSQPVGNESD